MRENGEVKLKKQDEYKVSDILYIFLKYYSIYRYFEHEKLNQSDLEEQLQAPADQNVGDQHTSLQAE